MTRSAQPSHPPDLHDGPEAAGSERCEAAGGERCDARSPIEPVDWQTAMKRALRSQQALRRYVGLPAPQGGPADETFPTFVPLEFAARIEHGNPDDPLLRQVLATTEEHRSPPGFVADPVGDLDAAVGGGVLHKYPGRALIITHGACAVHCRYCFRREFPYSEQGSRTSYWRPAIRYIRNTPAIEEVLLSGGDPLTLTDPLLDQLIGEIEAIGHVRRLRLHTRLPIVIPQRMTRGLLDRLADSPLAAWMVVHCNHANEIDDSVADVLIEIRRRGISVLNQAVLLAGVNDDADALTELSKTLINLGVQPYYLHQLDRVRGAAHFWVSADRGKALIAELRDRLPGYAVPKFVVEQAGEKSKTPIA
jgi:EF-P beta-lysylation protein EpmB